MQTYYPFFFLSYLSANPVKNMLLIIAYLSDAENQTLKDEIEKLFLRGTERMYYFFLKLLKKSSGVT